MAKTNQTRTREHPAVKQVTRKASPLFSFVITSYRNHKYIYEALDSVLTQDYPRIQLIISDDGSGDFPTERVRTYIDENAGDNITDVQVYAHETNRGTVQNMEFCRQKTDGEYIMYMAADDALNEPGVLSRYAAEFERLGPEAMLLCSKVAMCGENLSDIRSYEPSEEGIRCIRELSPQEMFGRLSHTWTIPTTSCCYRREIYDVAGPYDTEYFIIEDAPLFTRFFREGNRIYWVDDLTAARHRDGGISHGNTINLSESYRKYRYDEIIFYKKEVLPYQDQLSEADKKAMLAKWKYIDHAYFDTFVFPNMSAGERFRYNMKHFPQYLKAAVHRTRERAIGWIEDNYVNRILVHTSLICLAVFLALLFLPWGMRPELVQTLKDIVMITGFISIFLAIALRVLRIIRLIYQSIKFVFTGK